MTDEQSSTGTRTTGEGKSQDTDARAAGATAPADGASQGKAVAKRQREKHYILTEKDRERFWSKVRKKGPDECWEWTGARTKWGYGAFKWRGRKSGCVIYAHRVSFELEYNFRPMPFCLHKCDNPPCVNPAHLRQGTPMDNVEDMIKRGRAANAKHHPLGEKCGGSKLTAAMVEEIINTPKYHGVGVALARKFGVTESNISFIRKGRGWSHLSK